MPLVEAEHPCGTFCQDLVGVVVRFEHDLENPSREGIGHFMVEEVAHAVYEDHTRLSPLQRIRQSLWPQADGEGVAPSSSRRPQIGRSAMVR